MNAALPTLAERLRTLSREGAEVRAFEFVVRTSASSPQDFNRVVAALRERRIIGSALSGDQAGMAVTALVRVGMNAREEIMVADPLSGDPTANHNYRIDSLTRDLEAVLSADIDDYVEPAIWDDFAQDRSDHASMTLRPRFGIIAADLMLSHVGGGSIKRVGESTAMFPASSQWLEPLTGLGFCPLPSRVLTLSRSGARLSAYFVPSDAPRLDHGSRYAAVCHLIPKGTALFEDHRSIRTSVLSATLAFRSEIALDDELEWDSERPDLFMDQEGYSTRSEELSAFLTRMSQVLNMPATDFFIAAVTSAGLGPEEADLAARFAVSGRDAAQPASYISPQRSSVEALKFRHLAESFDSRVLMSNDPTVALARKARAAVVHAVLASAVAAATIVVFGLPDSASLTWIEVVGGLLSGSYAMYAIFRVRTAWLAHKYAAQIARYKTAREPVSG